MDHKRLTFRVTTQLQTKIMTLMLTALVLPSLIFGGALLYINKQISLNALNTLNNEFLSQLIIKTTAFIFITFPTLVIMFWILALYLVNKIVGPIERITKELNDITKEGCKKKKITIRKDDDLLDLTNAINKLLKKFM